MKKVFFSFICAISVVHGTNLVLSDENYPNVKQPQAKQALERFKQDYQKLDQNVFIFPDAIQQPACDVEEEEVYKASGIPLSESIKKMNKENRKIFRANGLNLNDLKIGTSNVKIVPLSITCKGNYAEGVAEFIASYDMNTDQKTVSIVTHTVTRQKSIFKNGKFQKNDGPGLKQITTTIKYTDPAVQEMMDKAKDPDPIPTLSISYYDIPTIDNVIFNVSKKPVVSAGLFGVKTNYVPSLMSMYTFSTIPDHGRMETYIDKNLVGVQYTKNHKMHGENIIYMKNFLKGTNMRLDQMAGYENAKIVIQDGEEMIEKKSCYIDGVLTKTTECPKE